MTTSVQPGFPAGCVSIIRISSSSASVLAAAQQAIALEQRLLLERLEMLGDAVDEILVGNVLWESPHPCCAAAASR